MLTLSNIHKKIKLPFIDYFLIIGIVLAPMTGLRIWKIGPGEVLCLFWSIPVLK